jgi:NTP pyrophosphatase (non-canonical NTP hydrolase)
MALRSQRSRPTLDALLERQFASQRDVYKVDPLTADVSYVIKNLLAAFVELGELAHEVEWREWRSDYGVVRENFTDELADVLRHLMNVCLAVGVCGDDIEDALTRSYERTDARDTGNHAPSWGDSDQSVAS